MTATLQTVYVVKADDEELGRYHDAETALIIAEICRRDEDDRGTGRKVRIEEDQ